MNFELRSSGPRYLRALALSSVLVSSMAEPSGAQSDPTNQIRWGGTVFDTFTLDGEEVWTCEDGGRIRHRDGSGVWTHQAVPVEVKAPILRIHFLSDGLTGWAVSQDGYLLKTTNGGADTAGRWSVLFRSEELDGFDNVRQELWDVHFLDEDHGWLLGLHAMWYTETGGEEPEDWEAVRLCKEGTGVPGVPCDSYTLSDLEEIEFYAFDVAEGTDPPILGLASAEPGLIFRTKLDPSFDPTTWLAVFDILSLCESLDENSCEYDICEDVAEFEPWDIEIGPDPDEHFAIMVGGHGYACGMAFSSSDDGLTWNKEEHECVDSPTPCTNSSDPSYYKYNFDPAHPTNLYRLKTYHTLYGAAILDGEGLAVATGYAGQIVVRNPSTGVWHDRSQYHNDYVAVQTAVTNPMKGVSAPADVASNTTAIVSGLGGYMRRSDDSGETWTTEAMTDGAVGEPWRLGDVAFLPSDTEDGWMVSQFYRVAMSTNGAATWDEAAPAPDIDWKKLLSVSFRDSTRGVTVGTPDSGASNPYNPKILYYNSGTDPDWHDATYTTAPSQTSGQCLYEVEWVSGSHFWAAGAKGLIVQSTDNGATWNVITPPTETPSVTCSPSNFDIRGMGFASASKFLFVGTCSGSPAAYQYRIGSPSTWTRLSISDPSPPSGQTITSLWDVDIAGSTAYAVGMRTHSSSTVRSGVLLRSTVNGSGNFVTFTVIQSVSECELVEDYEITLGVRTPVLNQVEIAPGGACLLAGGECGRLWKLTFGSPDDWAELKSQTSSGILGISFPAAGVAYLAAHRNDKLGSGSSIVRYQP